MTQEAVQDQVKLSLDDALACHNDEVVARSYWAQGEFFFIHQFLSQSVIDQLIDDRK